MSNWAEREEAERFRKFCADSGVGSCSLCGALIRDWDLHIDFHADLSNLRLGTP